MAIVSARDLVIEFPIYGAAGRSLKKTMMRAATGGVIAATSSDRVIVRAIDHVTFDFNEGERIGLVGHNGSGKTTLLRAIAGVYEPGSGSIEVRGRIASMLSIDMGMDVEATGWDNIFLRGAIMGLRRREITRLIDDVCEFAGLGDYVYMPMRTYSSGMIMRLMFAISTSVKADIILMDEWLSVGDDDFSNMAQKRLLDLVDQASLLVIASHDREVIRNTCTRVVHFEHGRIVESE